MKVAILGAGIVGMSSAVALQRKFPQIEFSVIAEKFSPEITSDVAAGLILPFLVQEGNSKLQKWFETAIKHCKELVSQNADGVQEMVGYIFNKEVEPLPAWRNTVPYFNVMSPEELKAKHYGVRKSGYYVSTYYIEPTAEIKRLTEEFTKNGGKLVKKSVQSFSEVASSYDVIVNCTGLGARKLCNDLSIRPMRGQVVRIHAPLQRHFIVDDHNYILLNDNWVVVGGTADDNEWDTTVNEEVAKKLIEEGYKLSPKLKKGTILSHHVGLRPYRDDVRLELEYYSVNGSKKIPIIHNYGHGGSGVTLAWACAQDVVDHLGKLAQKSKI